MWPRAERVGGVLYGWKKVAYVKHKVIHKPENNANPQKENIISSKKFRRFYPSARRVFRPPKHGVHILGDIRTSILRTQILVHI